MAKEKLTALKVKSLNAPGRYGDGGGLWLQVRASDNPDLPPTKSWLLRFTMGKRQQQMGLGPIDLVSLSEARDKATAARKLILQGTNPLSAKKTQAAEREAAGALMTFKEVAEKFIVAHEPTWRTAKQATHWRNTLEYYAYPVFGSWLVRDVDVGAVLKAIEPIWTTKPETAARVRSRVERIIDYASARGWRTGDNPAQWRGRMASLLPSRGRVSKVTHHPALPWKDIGAFMQKLVEHESTGAKALRFTILTAARTTETTGARWSEIDLKENVWTVPAARMKAKREHRVPLSESARALLQSLKPDPASPAAFVFAGQSGKQLSNMAMTAVLRRMEQKDATVHGFRSTFRDWVGESTAYPRELAEAALAHVLRDKTEAAYSRGDALEKRRRLMEDWATFCGRSVEKDADVVPIRQHG